MSSNIKVLQVIPKLGYGGAETGCYDIAHYLPENNCKSFIVTSGGELLKFIDKKKVKLIRLPVQSKNPLLIIINALILIGIILFYNMLSSGFDYNTTKIKSAMIQNIKRFEKPHRQGVFKPKNKVVINLPMIPNAFADLKNSFLKFDIH